MTRKNTIRAFLVSPLAAVVVCVGAFSVIHCWGFGYPFWSYFDKGLLDDVLGVTVIAYGWALVLWLPLFLLLKRARWPLTVETCTGWGLVVVGFPSAFLFGPIGGLVGGLCDVASGFVFGLILTRKS